MSDVPDDIRETARRVAEGVGSEMGYRTYRIAAALMAERERCAKYIESVYDYDTESIAAAIRRGDHTGF